MLHCCFVKFIFALSLQRILRDRSFPRTSDIDWGKFIIFKKIIPDFTPGVFACHETAASL